MAVRRLTAYTPGEQPAGEVVKLNTNENPYPPSPDVLKALRNLSADALRRYPDPVCRALRKRLGRLHGVGEDRVFVGNGSDEILALALRAFVDRGGSAGWFDPSYSLYPVLAAIEEVEARPVPLGRDFGWKMPGGYSASLFFLTRPNAPTGVLYPKPVVRSFCRRFCGVVLVDEAYVDFAKDDCIDLARELPNVLVARTLSKSYSLAGLRLGYAVGPAPLIEALYKIKDSYNVGAPAQAAALAALDDTAWMRRNARKIKATRRRTAAALEQLGFAVTPSDANFLWARPPAGADAAGLFSALRERELYVRYFPGPRTGAHLRITIGTDEQMARLLSALRSLLRK